MHDKRDSNGRFRKKETTDTANGNAEMDSEKTNRIRANNKRPEAEKVDE